MFRAPDWHLVLAGLARKCKSWSVGERIEVLEPETLTISFLVTRAGDRELNGTDQLNTSTSFYCSTSRIFVIITVQPLGNS
jgi:hypothetical protein